MTPRPTPAPRTYSFRLTAAEWAAGCTVTLTVTDTEAENDTLAIDLGSSTDVMTRSLFMAEETQGAATPDSGENWTTDTAVDAICTPEIAAEDHTLLRHGGRAPVLHSQSPDRQDAGPLVR